MAIDYEEIAAAGGLGKGEDHYDRLRRLRAEDTAYEDEQKALVRVRDKRCRWPRCKVCRENPSVTLHCAHVIEAKGMGSDHGTRSAANMMMLLDSQTHIQQERHRKDVRPLTDRGTDGPCEFWEKRKGEWHLVAKEAAPFVYERD